MIKALICELRKIIKAHWNQWDLHMSFFSPPFFKKSQCKNLCSNINIIKSIYYYLLHYFYWPMWLRSSMNILKEKMYFRSTLSGLPNSRWPWDTENSILQSPGCTTSLRSWFLSAKNRCTHYWYTHFSVWWQCSKLTLKHFFSFFLLILNISKLSLKGKKNPNYLLISQSKF